MNLLLVAAGAAVGAPLRYLTDRYVVTRVLRGAKPLPWGTLTVNVVGSFVLGLLTGVTDHAVVLLVGVGFCGAFTTYSTFAAETVQLARSGDHRIAALNAALNLGLGLTAALLGAALT
ncbi:CrcB protein [Kribbella flavida DSM 17836]|uniref:Fluoride-specific ion channel FluC n=1 Tax=Kribbella flavida (strain DSM 17836 / JCM 10339 / NBRC 14399) TaxID=479435 RepID=D2PXR2_KRIFD|nr:fluoride efflux transporter CrcB [Kribbella flavida]ADB31704.1 CrcB protein [Kribbella flavida DSM 17836]